MSQPGTHSAALAFLPQWWQDNGDVAALDATLTGWVRACGWKAGGFLWPVEGPTAIAKSAPQHANGEHSDLGEAVNRLRAGEPTVVVSVPGGASRVYAPVMCSGRPLAVLWADRPAGESWSEIDREYLALAGRSLERSPIVLSSMGPAVDPDRVAQRLADAALIAGRMAHDFDNILTGILGFTDLTLPMLPPDSQAASYLSEIANVGQRGITFTQQLHAFNRGGDLKPTPGSVAATLGREELRLKAAAPPGVRIEKELQPNLPAVAIDAGPLQAALGHVFENAIEACAKAGHVKVTATTADLGESDARAFLGKMTPGSYLIVSFTDSGPGIKPEVRKRLFAEPFFTTKARHRGLGLATTYRIVTAHRGGLLVESAPGSGTIVRIAFPLAVSRPSVSAATPAPAYTGLREDAVRPITATIVRG